jgi:hypothetical protein
MGEVYKARDLQLGRHVAVKTLPQAAASDHSAADRFDREARLIASLTSPLPGCWRRRQHGQSAGSLGEFGAQPARELDRFSTLVSIRSWLSDWKPHRSLVMTGVSSRPVRLARCLFDAEGEERIDPGSPARGNERGHDAGCHQRGGDAREDPGIVGRGFEEEPRHERC